MMEKGGGLSDNLRETKRLSYFSSKMEENQRERERNGGLF